MMKRNQQILAAILVLQLVLSVVFLWPRPTEANGKPLFPNVKAEDITSLTIVDDHGTTVTMKKDGENWVLATSDDYPLNANAVVDTLKKILQMNTSNLVTKTAASHKQLRVASGDFVRHVTFETQDGSKYSFYLGTAPRYTATHVRLEGQDETYLTPAVTEWDLNTTFGTWGDTNYFKVDPEQLTKITVENDHGTLTFVQGDNGWTLQNLQSGEEADSSKISGLVGKVATVVMREPLGKTAQPSYGIDHPAATVTLTKKDGSTVTLTFGPQTFDDHSAAVKASTSPYYARVNSFNVEKVIGATKEDFLKLPPTPAPTASP